MATITSGHRLLKLYMVGLGSTGLPKTALYLQEWTRRITTPESGKWCVGDQQEQAAPGAFEGQ